MQWSKINKEASIATIFGFKNYKSMFILKFLISILRGIKDWRGMGIVKKNNSKSFR